MRKDRNIVSYTADELHEIVSNGGDLTDWDRVRTLTDEEIEASVDFDDEGHFDWETAIPVSYNLSGKRQLTIRLDDDILEFFRRQGRGYQTRINSVLRSYVESQTATQDRNAHRKAS